MNPHEKYKDSGLLYEDFVSWPLYYIGSKYEIIFTGMIYNM